MGPFQPFMICLLISVIAGLVVYIKDSREFPYLKFLVPFLFLTLMIELWGNFLNKHFPKSPFANTVLYNFFSIQWVVFYLGLVSMMIHNRLVKKIIWIIMPLYAIVATLNVFYGQGMKMLHTVTNSIGYLLIAIFCIWYFLELFRLPKSIDLKRSPAFWICSGLLFFCCCGVPLYGFIELWVKYPLVINNMSAIHNFMNIFLYSLFTIAFLCFKTRKYSSSSS